MHAALIALFLMQAAASEPPAQAAQPAAEQTAPATPPAAPAQTASHTQQSRLICRNEMHAGTRFPVRRCVSREQADQAAATDQATMREWQSHGENMRPDQ